ncbi:hypothetical protein BDN72DRAFT_831954 [Pluteus cervinus]|uniref:Uncharacterized protein n=1 Tax=Pluteus cervinus TaxID=181527 RepID=A0ACD3BDA9_9AGAR|nr:hypothetical protein BDN72DRAFT_831954 [Pluteus cervinus]
MDMIFTFKKPIGLCVSCVSCVAVRSMQHASSYLETPSGRNYLQTPSSEGRHSWARAWVGSSPNTNTLTAGGHV